MAYPKGTRFQAWSLYTEKQKGVARSVIKRWVSLPNGQKRCERLPTSKYAHLRARPEELAGFVTRLNAELEKERRIRKGVDIRHAYINNDLLAVYEKRRRRDVPSQGRVTTEMCHLREHVIGFFVNRLNLQSPQEWYGVHREDWADYLLHDPKVPTSPSSKREIIQTANRFLAFLREKRPTEFPFEMILTPISKDRFKDMSARRELDPKVKQRTFITDEDWKVIVKNLTPELKPFVMLAYAYGLRRNETLGVLPGDVKTGYMGVTRQLERMAPTEAYKPLKGKDARKVRHWFSTAAKAYLWVQEAQKYRVDEDALSGLWKDMMDALGFKYTFHELRHTFLTNCFVAGHDAREIQLAAGHKRLSTTMGYVHDARKVDDEVFKPAS